MCGPWELPSFTYYNVFSSSSPLWLPESLQFFLWLTYCSTVGIDYILLSVYQLEIWIIYMSWVLWITLLWALMYTFSHGCVSVSPGYLPRKVKWPLNPLQAYKSCETSLIDFILTGTAHLLASWERTNCLVMKWNLGQKLHVKVPSVFRHLVVYLEHILQILTQILAKPGNL